MTSVYEQLNNKRQYKRSALILRGRARFFYIYHIPGQSYGWFRVQQYGQEKFMMELCGLLRENGALLKQKSYICPSRVLKAYY